MIPYRLIGGPNHAPTGPCDRRCAPAFYKPTNNSPNGYFGFPCDCKRTAYVLGGPFDGAEVGWTGPYIAAFVPGLFEGDDRYALYTYCNRAYRYSETVLPSSFIGGAVL